jgi:DNA-binding transcriptional LysR family regulator
MELRHLRYFVAVAETLHFGQAAAALEIAQPTLSHQIQQLENELRTGLLRRTKRRVELTEAGRVFLQEARELLARADRAAMIARRLGSANAHRLRVGIGYCMDHSAIASAVGELVTQTQQIQTQIQTMSVPAQLAALSAGELDAAFIRPPVSDLGLEHEVLVTEPLVVALPRNHPLASSPHISLPELANEAFVLPPREAVPVFHDAVLKACRDAGFVPNAPHEADHLQLVVALVARGRGVALLPAAASRMLPNRVVYRPIVPSAGQLETAIAWRSDDHSSALAEFIAVAKQVFTRRHDQPD